MREPLIVRIKQWICKVLGHRRKFSHRFNNRDFYVCKRCGKFI